MSREEGIDLIAISYDSDHYKYSEIKPALFLEKNQKGFLNIRERVLEMLKYAGAVQSVAVANQHFMGNTYGVYAVLDRMVELGEVVEIPQQKVNVGDRVFVKVRGSE
jgi:hypothetical protein